METRKTRVVSLHLAGCTEFCVVRLILSGLFCVPFALYNN